MRLDNPVFRLDQLHIDVARNATDDFNPFHDPHRWNRIRGNPFGGPIALGFQLEALVDFLIERQRDSESDGSGLDAQALPFGNYEFRFAHELQSGESFRAEVRRTIRARRPGGNASNRVALQRDDGTPILIGSRTDTPQPRFLPEWDPACLPSLDPLADRSFVADTGFFLKRKFLNNSNAKNFLLGSLVDQFHYFDELSERIRFPAIFTAALISCALLEKAWAEGYDFERDPQVYVAHYFSIDRRLQEALRSNRRLDILIDGPRPLARSGGLSGARTVQDTYRCFGMVGSGRTLFRAEVRTTSLQRLLNGAGVQ